MTALVTARCVGGPPVATDPAASAPTHPCSTRGSASRSKPPRPFTIPGHKQRTDLVGDVVAGDAALRRPRHDEADVRVIAEAEARAARLGARTCRFSTGGATHANQAVAPCVVAGEGDTVVVSRTLHRPR